jgi:Fe-S-cluster containining protein
MHGGGSSDAPGRENLTEGSKEQPMDGSTNGATNGSANGVGTALHETVMAAVGELDRQLERGSFFTQAVFHREFSRLERAEALLTRLVDVLAERGVLSAEELGLVASSASDPGAPPHSGPAEPEQEINWPSIALRVDDPDEPDRTGVTVDCSARLHICHAVCCKLKFPLSCEEVDAGKVKWDIGHPYVIRHEASGYCTHNDPAGGCRIYENRPAVCRRYSCVNDTRIWKDFDNMVLNQEWIDEHLGPRDLHVAAVVPPMEPVDEP